MIKYFDIQYPNGFSLLEVTGMDKNSNDRGMRGIFLCACGKKTKSIRIGMVKSGKTISCGCSKVEAGRKSATIHGLCHHPLNSVYRKIKERLPISGKTM